MALSKIQALCEYETKMSGIVNKIFGFVIKHGMFGEHMSEPSQDHPAGQAAKEAEGESNIFHMAGSNGEKTAACRNFNDQPLGALIELEFDVLLELFEFDKRAVNETIQKARPGFYHIKCNEHLPKYLRGKHFNRDQAVQLIESASRAMARDSVRTEDENVGLFKDTLSELFPWYDFSEWLENNEITIEASLEEANGFIPPDILKKLSEISTLRAQQYRSDPNSIFGDLLPFPMDWNFTVTINGPAVTTEIRFLPKSLPMTICLLSLDIVTCAKLTFWPDDANDFLSRKRHWPPPEVIRQCEQSPVQVVPKFRNVGDKNEWYLSFVVQERLIAEARTVEMKFTFYLFKILFYTHFKKDRVEKEDKQESLSTYVAKTTMMWACEELDPDDWNETNRNQNLQLLIVKLLAFLECSTLPHYFIEEINILENTPEELIQKVIKSVEDSGVCEDPIANLPSEKRASDVLARQHMLYDVAGDNLGKLEDILRNNPWAFIKGPDA